MRAPSLVLLLALVPAAGPKGRCGTSSCCDGRCWRRETWPWPASSTRTSHGWCPGPSAPRCDCSGGEERTLRSAEYIANAESAWLGRCAAGPDLARHLATRPLPEVEEATRVACLGPREPGESRYDWLVGQFYCGEKLAWELECRVTGPEAVERAEAVRALRPERPKRPRPPPRPGRRRWRPR